jgi:DNA-binding transcriptional ArsR family regulator/uracil phosphoribosyltransferase
MKTRDLILKLLKKHSQMTVHDLAVSLKISRQYIHRMLNELEDDELVMALGKAPKVYYSLKLQGKITYVNSVTFENELFLKQHFILVDPLGNLLEGLEAMKYWCEKQSLPLNKTIFEYITTRKKYLIYFNEDELIDGKEKLVQTKGLVNVGVDYLYYLDFYAIERFGKTRLGTLMHYAKQGQNKQLMKRIVSEIRQRVYKFIEEKKIDAVLFVPPTIARKVQIMTVLQNLLKLDCPSIKVEKIKNQIVVPQKALSKIFERIANAKNTFYVPNQKKYKRVLIIDDAIGSGATINEIALKLKEKKIANEILGLAITGSYKGFDVISEL